MDGRKETNRNGISRLITTWFGLQASRPQLERFVPRPADEPGLVRTEADGIDTPCVTAANVHPLHRLLGEIQSPNDESLVVRTAGKAKG